MKRNGELETKDIRIGDLETDGDEGKEIVAYIETWFDVDKKFRVRAEEHTSELQSPR